MKTNIALPPFHIAETTRFTVEADHELTQTLRRYQAFYKEAYSTTVTEAELLREMVRRFMASDGDFQGFGQKKRRTNRKPLGASSVEPSSNGKLSFGGLATYAMLQTWTNYRSHRRDWQQSVESERCV